MFYALVIAAIGGFLFYVLRKPDAFSLQRQININASPTGIYPWINNLRNMNQWNLF